MRSAKNDSNDYAKVASIYAGHRWALPWKLEPIVARARRLETGGEVVDIGCGTGDYLQAIHSDCPRHHFVGIDASPEMVAYARARCPWARFEIVDLDAGFRLEEATIDVMYSIDVLHHLTNYEGLFDTCAHALRPGAVFVVITDSPEDIRTRTLAQFFPETVAINLDRYPKIETLIEVAARADLRLVSQRPARGLIDLDDRLMAALADKAISELRMIDESVHAAGMKRATVARNGGTKWVSQTTVVEWTRD